MKADFNFIAGAICALAAFAVFVGGAWYIANMSTAYYYATARACIDRGGTWIPINSGICIPKERRGDSQG